MSKIFRFGAGLVLATGAMVGGSGVAAADVPWVVGPGNSNAENSALLGSISSGLQKSHLTICNQANASIAAFNEGKERRWQQASWLC